MVGEGSVGGGEGSMTSLVNKMGGFLTGEGGHATQNWVDFVYTMMGTLT